MENKIKNNAIHDWVDEFKNKYENLHYKNVENKFNEIIKESKIDVEDNIKKNNILDKKRIQFEKTNSKINILKKTMMVFLILIVVPIIFIMFYASNIIVSTLSLVLSILALILFIGLEIWFFILLNKSKTLDAKLSLEIKELENYLINQTNYLNSLLNVDIPFDLFKKSFNFLKFDDYFSAEKLGYIKEKFDFRFDDFSQDNRTVLGTYTGEIHGNPFLVVEELEQTIRDKVYEGWISVSVRKKNRTVVEHLTATLVRPAPFYSRNKYIMFASNAAPDLSFTKKAKFAHLDIAENPKSFFKKAKKSLKKHIENNPSFTMIGNEEFESIFQAWDRDNETQYRLLFTPLAQQKMTKLLLDDNVGYGDDFNFHKIEKWNIIQAEHLDKIDFHLDPDFFHDYNVNKIKTRFYNYNNEYFRALYFSFAPLFTIPLYQQIKTKDYIYNTKFNNFYSEYEHESIANKIQRSIFKNTKSNTPLILKTNFIQSNDEYSDQINVTSHGFKAIEKIEYVPVMDSEGDIHSVPVKWYDYIPTKDNASIELNGTRHSQENKEKYKLRLESLKNEMNNKNLVKKVFALNNFIVKIINNK
ncbi:MAG1210 family protein [[Mycoplasma] collis]|uniref:MAG1210 family protein n=1 Tax=[Mycoplasma] collis TaxID=2127 RepID=UPI00051C02CE|nr:hypothetical protein [[Mycoplasma] collis]